MCVQNGANFAPNCTIKRAIGHSMHNSSKLDDFDIRLLAALQNDGRLTNQEAADRVGLSSSQCSRRRALLETSGYITGYHAQLSAEALGFGLLAIIQVTLNAHNPDNAQHFRDLVAGLDEVQEAYAVTGDTDYQLKAIVSDLKALAALVNERLLPHQSVARVRSSIVLERLKDTSRLPLHALPDHGSPR
jgi:DNA-binding Lrp family transcriptional regulator